MALRLRKALVLPFLALLLADMIAPSGADSQMQCQKISDTGRACMNAKTGTFSMEGRGFYVDCQCGVGCDLGGIKRGNQMSMLRDAYFEFCGSRLEL